MKIVKIIKNVCLCLLLGLASNLPCTAFAASPTSAITADVESALTKVLATKDGKLPSDATLAPLFDFMMTNNGTSFRANPSKRSKEGMGVFWRGTINKPLPTTLQFLYNPKIPTVLLYPSSIRLSKWLPGSEFIALKTPLWEQLNNLETPVVVTGKEYEEISPDTFSGSYYSYTLKRLISLQKYKGKPLLFSVSWQDGNSSEGKKSGYIGDYGNWDYVYTNAQGATASGIGWMSTYMYASCSVSLLYEEADGKTGYAIFKWLKAGWSGVNAVKREHIKSGAERNFKGMLQVINNKRIAGPETLEKLADRVYSLDRPTLLKRTTPYAQKLEELAAAHEILSQEDFTKVLAGGNYGQTLNIDQLKALIALNELKKVLGKPVLGE